MPDQETIVQETADADWDEPLMEDEPLEELPADRVGACSGRAGIRVPLALLGVLLIACGFIGGVLVEKGQSTTSSSAGSGATGLASRFAALRGAVRRRHEWNVCRRRVGRRCIGRRRVDRRVVGGGGGFFGRSGGARTAARARPPGRSRTYPGARCM